VWGTSDPYAVLTVGPSSHTSKVVDRSLDPEWDESFVLFVRYAPFSPSSPICAVPFTWSSSTFLQAC
jgi:hypothetical protein